MNTRLLPWLATALTLVDNYAQVRATGGTSRDANLATLQAVTELISHFAQHPAAVAAPTEPQK